MTPEELFEQNKSLVHFIYSKHFALSQEIQSWKDDILQEGLIALWKACKSYDEAKGFSFSTLACACIHSAMVTYINRKILKHNSTVSFEEIISEDADGNQIKLGDCIPGTNTESTLEILNILKAVLSQCSERAQQVNALILQGYKQEEISVILGISQTMVSRDWNKFKEKFKICLEELKK
jgi:RNA polymerase sigma factor (sigma-70 family)